MYLFYIKSRAGHKRRDIRTFELVKLNPLIFYLIILAFSNIKLTITLILASFDSAQYVASIDL